MRYTYHTSKELEALYLKEPKDSPVKSLVIDCHAALAVLLKRGLMTEFIGEIQRTCLGFKQLEKQRDGEQPQGTASSQAPKDT